MKGSSRVITGFLFICLLLSPDVHAQRSPVDLLKHEWIEVRSDDIVVITDTDRKTALSLLSDLERFKQVVFFVLDIKPKTDIPPLTVYAFSRKDDYKLFVDREDIAGYFSQLFMDDYAVVDLNGYDSTKRSNFPRYILFHEYVHYVFRSYFLVRSIPLWYQEGFADFMSTTTFESNYVSVGLANEYRLFDISTDFDVESLLYMYDRPHTRTATSKFYKQSYAIVHYLNMNNDYKPKVTRYLDELYNGQSVQIAFQTIFGISFEEFNKQIKRYVKQEKYPYWKFDESSGLKLSEPRTSEPRLLSQSEFAMHMGKILYNQGEDENIKDLAFSITNHSIRLDNKFAKSYGYLALFYMDENKTDEARIAVEKAIELEPDSAWINTVYGIWLLNLAEKQLVEGDENWINSAHEARRKFRAAIDTDKNSALAYSGLGDVYYMVQDFDDLNEGIISYNQAIYLTPLHHTIYKLAILYFRNEETDEAKVLLTHLVRDSKNADLTKVAMKLLRKLEHLNPGGGVN